jgi:hypothetical protein
MKGTVTMSHREIDRLKVIHNVLDRRLTWDAAAERLDLSRRQIGYLCARVREEGNTGIIHGLRGQPSNHQMDPAILEKALALVQQHYPDFGPTFANEKLRQVHGVVISTTRLRLAMMGQGLWKSRKVKHTHRAWRERRSCLGMLIQLDGSDHDWFEGRGPRCVLLVFIDDATSQILHAEFVPVEDTLNLMKAAQTYLLAWGRPAALYVDKDSIYKINRQATIEEQLRDNQPMTQFTRAMEELGVQVICAHSPQAKGRVERGFDTHQDRLVKELRLAGISTIPDANRFLRKVYLPDHNRRCAVEPRDAHDAHRPLLKDHRLEEILSLRTPRGVANDFTLRYKNQFFQLTADQPLRVRPKNTVLVEIRLDGSTHIRFKDHYLNFTPIPKKPYRPAFTPLSTNTSKNTRIIASPNAPGASPRPLKTLRQGPTPSRKPPPDHPWRRFRLPGSLQFRSATQVQFLKT